MEAQILFPYVRTGLEKAPGPTPHYFYFSINAFYEAFQPPRKEGELINNDSNVIWIIDSGRIRKNKRCQNIPTLKPCLEPL
jgi:hypothetical protein